MNRSGDTSAMIPSLVPWSLGALYQPCSALSPSMISRCDKGPQPSDLIPLKRPTSSRAAWSFGNICSMSALPPIVLQKSKIAR
jgi:hypothetical protein